MFKTRINIVHVNNLPKPWAYPENHQPRPRPPTGRFKRNSTAPKPRLHHPADTEDGRRANKPRKDKTMTEHETEHLGAVAVRSTEFKEIWLEPAIDADPYEGRQWCQDNVWGEGAVHYVLAAELIKVRANIELLCKVLEPFALMGTEGLVKQGTKYSTVTSLSDYFHDAADALATIKDATECK